MHHIYSTTLFNLRDNRWIGLEFLWYVTEVLLPQLKMKWAGPLFLFEKTSATPPLLPCDSPERTSVATPDLCPHPPSVQLFIFIPPTQTQPAPSPPLSHSWSAKVLLPWWWSNATTSSVEGSLDLFSRPPAQGPDERLLPRETAEWKQREFIRAILSKLFFFCFFLLYRSPLSLQKVCAPFSINIQKLDLSLAAFPVSWIPCPLTTQPWML